MLNKSFKTISATYSSFYKNVSDKLTASIAAEWLLDNFYIIDREVSGLKNIFKRPRKRNIRYENRRALAFSLACRMAEECDYKVDEYRVISFLENLQNERPLTSDELWLFPAYAKLAIINKIAELCRDIDNVSGEKMGNLINSLISIGDIDWTEKFEELSLIDRILARGCEDFCRLSFETKEVYRKEIAKMARECGKSEEETAHAAVALCEKSEGKKKHIGYFFIDEGQSLLRSKLGGKKKQRVKLGRVYAAAAILGIAVLLAGVYRVTGTVRGVLLAVIPAAEICITLVNFIAGRFKKPRHLPAYEFEGEVPAEGRTAIVYPVLLSNRESVGEICRKLEVCYVANRDDNLIFVVLGDLKDGGKEVFDDDAEIIGLATEKITRLNEQYGDRFFLLSRERRYNQAQGKWMVWERKRGALTQFCEFLRSADSFQTVVGAREKIGDISYVLTLDADTVLPIGGAKKLIGAALHPLNRPVINEKKNIVEEGYAIIKPKISIDVESASKTLFSRIFAGQGGIDPYSAAVSDLYMDVFGEAIFTGKGIFDVDAFLKCTKKAIPENTVLSHDLLEGSYLRCALFSSVEVYDGYPSSFEAYSKRQHRWIRGDWQLLPWLGRYVKNADGKKIKNPLSVLSRWKIADNLRRSVTPVFQALLIIIAGVLFPEYSGVCVGFVLISLVLPLLLYIIDSLFGKRILNIREKRNSNIIYGVKALFYQTTLSISFLAYGGAMAADAVIRTVSRVLFTKKHTLEWVTAADAEQKKREGVMGYYVFMSWSVVLAAAALVAALANNRDYLGVAVIFCIIWSAAPALAFGISRKEEEEKSRLTDRSKKFLLETAEKTWNFFRDFASETDNFLPPDNVQLRPYKGIAHRTSPTNIGLYMLCVVGARDLEFISTEEMESRLSKTISTIEKMEKWKGHLLNWYDTKTLRPLYPRYVSTVDSGNFLCYLMVTLAGVRDYGGEKSESIIMRLNKIIDEMHFDVLFDDAKKLFSIGFNIEENRLSSSYYDMLASEARQTVFLSVARAEIKPKNWFRLGRGLTGSDGYKGLISWTGTMFEYLMPLIIMKNYENTLLDESYFFALHCQKRYGRKRRVPWGTSESGFFGFDVNLNYQYKAFGVPSLGLKRGLSEEVVVAPYASMLALMVEPKSSLYNLLLLKKEGAYGEYGFYEAIDYTPSRAAGGGSRSIVKSYMAHHQGMGLSSIVNVLCDNVMQKRFHSWPQIQAAEPLLQERVPVGIELTKDIKERIAPLKIKWQETVQCVREIKEDKGVLPQMHVLSNGTYGVTIDSRGGGVSAYDNINLGKMRTDPCEPGRGNMIFLRTQEGVTKSVYGEQCTFSPHMAEFKGELAGLQTNLQICVLPEDSAELRRLTVVNNTGERQVVEVTSYTDISLASHSSEISHSAFSNLFVTTSFEGGSLFAERKIRDESDKAYAGFYTAFVQGETEGDMQFETDRAKFLGRGNDVFSAQEKNWTPILGGGVGSVLDPCFAVRIKLIIKEGESASVNFISGVCETICQAKKTAEKYSRRGAGADPLTEAYNHERLQLISLKENDEEAFLGALPYLYYGGYGSKEQMECIRINNKPLQELWKLGISGDVPIVLLKISDEGDEEILAQMLRAHKYWMHKGITVDLVIICDEAVGYNTPLLELAREKVGDSVLGQKGGVFVIGGQEILDGDKTLLIAASKIYVDARSGGLESFEACAGEFRQPQNPIRERSDTRDVQELKFENGYGGFSRDGSEYVIFQKRQGDTPAPWVNVIANEKFGFVAGESGGGYTWYKNSRETRLTMWYNDAVTDPLTEKLIICEDGEYWSVTAGALGETGEFKTTHGIGYTRYERKGPTDGSMTVFVPPEESVKIIWVKLKNNENKQKTLKVKYTLTPVMGVSLYETRGKIRAYLTENGAVAENAFSNTGEKMFLYSDGRCGVINRGTKEAVDEAYGIDAELEAEKKVLLKQGEEAELIFLMGAGDSDEDIKRIVFENKDNPAKRLEESISYFKSFNAVKVHTPSEGFNFLANNWLIYQAVSCRIMGRSGFYQSGGAYGFRDQLQDVLSLLCSAPEVAKKQILRAAAHQFTEGDAMHWWHEGKVHKGVRTRFSDDRLWLPYVVSEYIKVTGDKAILEETVPYAFGAPLGENEHERYFEIQEFASPETLYSHCLRAADVSLRFGSHGLPLIGGGDWNDGMNCVGLGGRGESVWMAWFLKSVLERMADLCGDKGDKEKAAVYKKCILQICESANENAWDGEWFKRAFFDDGTPLGSIQNVECSIDSISQSWAVISGAAEAEKAKTALESAYKMLVDNTHGVVKLLTPPFDRGPEEPGYIKSYLPGVRENGGQYTHAAVWLAIAETLLGNADRAMELFDYINPINHSKTQLLANVYKAEPYVLAADVYSVAPHEGRGGWTWYTGAASWMYKLAVEYILGFKKEGDIVRVTPCIPEGWKEFTLTYRFLETNYVINCKVTGEKSGGEFKLINDKKVHEINLTI